MTIKAVGIVIDDPSNLWFRYRDVSVVKRSGREVHVHLHNGQIVIISTPSDAGASKLMRDIVTTLEQEGQTP